MPQLPIAEKLASNQHVTVVLRLLVDRRGRLLHGELVDAEGKLWRRFTGWRQLIGVIREWIAKQARENAPRNRQGNGSNLERDSLESE